MVGLTNPRQVLIAASPSEAMLLHRLFIDGPLFGWEARTAHTFTQARFHLQHELCGALLLDEAIYRQEGPDGLAWLGSLRDVPVVFLTGVVPEMVTELLAHGVEHWLPRDLALAHPRLLAATLEQALRTHEERGRLRTAGEALHLCRKQVGRLVNLLWETTPQYADAPWFTQRHMMERLQEEVARADRQGGPFTVALGEVSPAATESPSPTDPTRLGAWTAERVRRIKRRADVAGRYGPYGFMLLLVQTPEANAALGCRRLQNALEKDAALANEIGYSVQVKFGLAGYSAANCHAKGLLSRAEKRLAEARATRTDHLVVEN